MPSLLAHALATIAIVALALRLTSQVERPSPTTVAKLEAEGVVDPEAKLNDTVRARQCQAVACPAENPPRFSSVHAGRLRVQANSRDR